jgi:kinetochore protein Nuf2
VIQLCICRGESETQLFTIPSRIKKKQAKLAHPELYNDAFREVKFYDQLQKQLRICGYNEFGFKDLAMPQVKRFKRQLSALINFLKYREDMAHLEIQALEEVSTLLLVSSDNLAIIIIFTK